MDSIFRKTMLPKHPGTIIVAYHVPIGFTDSLGIYPGNTVYDLYPDVNEQNAFPNGLGYGVDYHNIDHNIDSLYDQDLETPVVIEFNSKIWDSDTDSVELSLTIKNDGPELTGSYWYNVIVTEDSIIYSHATYPGCSTPDHPGGHFNTDSAYSNSWVTRKLVFLSEGKSLIENSWPEQHAITETCNFSMDNTWIPENCNVTVHVYKKADSLYKSPTMQVVQEPIIGWSDVTEGVLLEKGIMGIYPNPTKGLTNIHISLADKGFYILSVFDMNGKVVKHVLHGNRNPGLYNIEMQTNEMPGGTYIIVLETSTGKTSKKLVIQ